ncbi:MAG: DUF4253 domain-containing protein [Spirulina sp. SIO3F2]|nr:DUF4253 domain-containing protein [Spirulina sp. SIO3F2]
MLNSPQSLHPLLQGSLLEAREIVALPILDTNEITLAIDIETNKFAESWQVARSLVPQTGRWPIVIAFSSKYERMSKIQKVLLSAWLARRGTKLWIEDLKDEYENLLSRVGFKGYHDGVDVSPHAILERSHQIDSQDFIDRAVQNLEEQESAEDYLEDAICSIKNGCGLVLKREDIDFSQFQTRKELNIWLSNWKAEQLKKLHKIKLLKQVSENPKQWQLMEVAKNLDDEEGCYTEFDIHHSNKTALLLLPITSSWEALAYIDWYGNTQLEYGVESLIALGKFWERKFGAELVAFNGCTTFQCLVSRPPESFSEAWDIACVHNLSTPLTVEGCYFRAYVTGLIHHDRWVFQDLP